MARMSIRPVSFAQIECDSCGTCRDSITDRDGTAARISASRDGWKYVTWDIKGKGYQKYSRAPEPGTARSARETVPRQWDCCPDCPLPESPIEAAEIRARHKERNHLGKWAEKESA